VWNAVGVCEGSGHTKGDGCTVPRVGTLRILEGLTLLRGLVQPQVMVSSGRSDGLCRALANLVDTRRYA